MWHLGEGRPDEAWQNLLAAHRLSHLFTQSHTVVEQLIAMGVSAGASEATLTLLQHGDLTAELAKQIERDLAALPRFAGMARALDQNERFMALNAFTRLGTGGGAQLFSAMSGGQGDAGDKVFDIISVDWNLVLRESNAWYDRLAFAARLSDFTARQAALQQIEADSRLLFSQARAPVSFLAGVINRRERSKLISSMMLSLFLPSVQAATIAEDRANAMQDLLRLAAALAVFRAQHGAYPQQLEELVPGVLETLPVDHFKSQPYIYNRNGDGYLLYSAGANGADDNGSNNVMRILKGRPVDELNSEASPEDTTVPPGADDMSIRVPRPAFKLPELKAAEEAQQ
jgi:hypothetical protein